MVYNLFSIINVLDVATGINVLDVATGINVLDVATGLQCPYDLLLQFC